MSGHVMQSLGIVQHGDPILTRAARPFPLPAAAHEARDLLRRLADTADRVMSHHHFANGMGICAPQIGVDRAAAIVRPRHGEPLMLLNPRVVAESTHVDDRYEGCLSFFEVRGRVPRPLHVDVAYLDATGAERVLHLDNALARLVYHEIDHLNGLLYPARMRPGSEPIPYEQYRRHRADWTYA